MDLIPVTESVKSESIESSLEQQITFEIPENLNFDLFPGSSHNLSEYFHSEKFANVASVDLSGSTVTSGDSDSLGDLFGNWSSSLEYQNVLNYLWIAIVTSLILLSLIFVVFSCYFYRKFREWKKCNKDIRLQIPNDLYHTVANGEDGYYQVESPPCYTIATGLPTYDEALLQAHFTTTFGMKVLHPWVYPMRNNNNYTIREENPTTTVVVKEIENCIPLDEITTENDRIMITKECEYTRNSDCPEIVVIS